MADAVGAILLAALTLYANLGGADFGAGLWDLVAGGAERGRAPRLLIQDTITPVWEANHVWLIFALVIFWTAFPMAFAAVMVASAFPLWLAVLGILLRGAGFAFRKEVESLQWQRLLGATFAFSSLVAPFFMGTVIGAVVAGEVPVGAQRTTLAVWTGPLSLLIGALFVAVCAYLAAVFLIGEAARRSDPTLRRYFARRAALAGIVSGVLSLATLVELRHADPQLYDRLTGRALPLVLVVAALGLAALAFLVTGRSRGLRPLSALGVAAVIWGWGVAQYPAVTRHRLDPSQRFRPARHAGHHRGHLCRRRPTGRARPFTVVLVARAPTARARRPGDVASTNRGYIAPNSSGAICPSSWSTPKGIIDTDCQGPGGGRDRLGMGGERHVGFGTEVRPELLALWREWLDDWVQEEPFESWLAQATRPGGHDDLPGTVLVWRDGAGLPRHAAVTLGEEWALEKPSQEWSSPRTVLTASEVVRSARTPGLRLHRYRLDQ